FASDKVTGAARLEAGCSTGAFAFPATGSKTADARRLVGGVAIYFPEPLAARSNSIHADHGIAARLRSFSTTWRNRLEHHFPAALPPLAAVIAAVIDTSAFEGTFAGTTFGAPKSASTALQVVAAELFHLVRRGLLVGCLDVGSKQHASHQGG